MRRGGCLAADPDSDISVSEDEDFDEGSSNYCVSLGGENAHNHQEGIQVLFQLEKLRDTPRSVDGGVSTSVSKNNIQSKSKADEVVDNANTPRFGNNFQFIPSAKDAFPCGIEDEEIASDNEDEDCTDLNNSFNRGGFPTSQCQKNELEELASREFDEQLSAMCFKSKENKTISDDHPPDIEKRCRSLFSTDVCDASQKLQNLAQKSESFPAKNTEYPSADELEDFDEQHGIQSVFMQSNMTTVPGGHVIQSFADCLHDLQGETSLPREIHVPGKKRRKISRGGIKRDVMDTKFLDEVSPDPIGSESGSSEEESNYDDFKHHIAHHDRSTMAERFQEILNSSSANMDSLYSVQKPSSSGIFGQLQQLMQSQKDMDMEFLNMIRDGGCCGKIFGDVLILSRQLDAKLTVCQCSLKGNHGNPLSSDGEEAKSPATRERTVIFSPRVCSSVNLEIGNLIRIYPPWLEVKVRRNNQSMILCTYYSQVSSLSA